MRETKERKEYKRSLCGNQRQKFINCLASLFGKNKIRGWPGSRDSFSLAFPAIRLSELLEDQGFIWDEQNQLTGFLAGL